MPFVTSYTAPDGGEHPEAYWTPAWIGIDLHSEQATITYTGYHDQAHWYSGGSPIHGASRPYTVSGLECRQLIRSLLAIPGVADLLESLPVADFPAGSHVPFPTPPPEA